MPGIFRPSAGYVGRGVTLQSALEYMLYHQKSFAQVSPGRRRRAVSQTFSPATSRFDWRQSHASPRSRKYQPLPTMPWSRGSVPVSIVAWALQVTAGSTAPIGRMKPSRASAASAGVSGPTWAGVSPTTSMTRSGVTSRAGPAEDGVALEELARRRHRRVELAEIEPAALGEERDRILPDDLLDLVLGHALLPHQADGLRDLERVTLAPVGRAVDDHAVGAVLPEDLDHARFVHLRVGIDREAHRAAGVDHEGDGLFGVVVDEHALGREADLADDGQRPLDAPYLVAVRGVDEGGQVVRPRQLELGREVALLARGDGGAADLGAAEHAVLPEASRQDRHDPRVHPVVVGFLRVQRQGAVVAHAELLGAEALPADDRVEVVDEGADRRPRLPEPEGRLEYGDDARQGHPLVVVGDSGEHVGVRLEHAHGCLSFLLIKISPARPPAARRGRSRGEADPRGTAAPAGRRSVRAPGRRPSGVLRPGARGTRTAWPEARRSDAGPRWARRPAAPIGRRPPARSRTRVASGRAPRQLAFRVRPRDRGRRQRTRT